MWKILKHLKWNVGVQRNPFILFFLLSLFLPPCSAQKISTKTYTLAVVPQYSPAEIQSDWQPLLERLKKESGIELQLKFSSSIQLFEASFLRGEPDFAFVNPYHAVMAKKAHGYLPLIRNRENITGVLLVLKNSSFQKIEDLKNARIGFPSPNSFAASLLIRAHLSQQKIPFELEYLKSHSNVYRNLMGGFIAAAGGVSTTYHGEDPKIRDQFRILYQTPEAASHPLIVHPRVPEAIRTAITLAFLSLENDVEGISLLKNIRIPHPTKANYAQDYRPLEKLNIEKFVEID